MDAVIAYNMQFIGAGINQKYKIYAPPAPPKSGVGQTGDYAPTPETALWTTWPSSTRSSIAASGTRRTPKT